MEKAGIWLQLLSLTISLVVNAIGMTLLSALNSIDQLNFMEVLRTYNVGFSAFHLHRLDLYWSDTCQQIIHNKMPFVFFKNTLI